MFAKGLSLALEDIVEGDDAPEGTDASQSDDQVSTDAEINAQNESNQMVEAAENSNDFQEGIDEVGSGIDDQSQVNDHKRNLENTLDDGGASDSQMAVTTIAIEGIYKRLGITRSSKYPSLESFTTKGDRVANTKIAIEGLREVGQRIWEAIKAAFEKLKEFMFNIVKFLKTMIAKIIDSFIYIENKLNNLLDQPLTIKGHGFSAILQYRKNDDIIRLQRELESYTNSSNQLVETLSNITDSIILSSKIIKEENTDKEVALQISNDFNPLENVKKIYRHDHVSGANKEIVDQVKNNSSNTTQVNTFAKVGNFYFFIVTPKETSSDPFENLENISQLNFIDYDGEQKEKDPAFDNVQGLMKQNIPEVKKMLNSIRHNAGVYLRNLIKSDAALRKTESDVKQKYNNGLIDNSLGVYYKALTRPTVVGLTVQRQYVNVLQKISRALDILVTRSAGEKTSDAQDVNSKPSQQNSTSSSSSTSSSTPSNSPQLAYA